VRRERQSKERGVLTHDVADRRDWTRTQSLLQPPKGGPAQATARHAEPIR